MKNRYIFPFQKSHAANEQGTASRCTLFIALFIGIFLVPHRPLRGVDLPAAQVEFFETKIRPVLARECYECHSSAGKKKAGLALDFRDGLIRGGESGPAITPGHPDTSLLMEALRHENGLEMPKAGVKLDPGTIADFEKWIHLGAPDPRDQPPTPEEMSKAQSWEATFRERQKWWSFQPIVQPAVPAGEGSAIDRFIRARLHQENLDLARPAGARTLARRLHYSLTGLPATAGRLDAFEKAAAENREKAVAELIDELLASPRFGERWARHWMDWIRYAESHGSEGDPRIDNAYYYRDYLIRALNEDIPCHQLIREHIAGDLLEHPRYDQKTGINESAIGTAHWRMVFHGFAPTDALDEKVRFTDDQINTFTKAFLGLTVSCARCHNHKFDAISQADYYALFGILGSTRPGRKLIDPPAELEKNKARLAELKPKIRAALAEEWLASLGQLAGKLQDRENWDDDEGEASLYFPFQLLAKDSKMKPADAWKRAAGIWKGEANKTEAKLRFNLATGDDYKNWFRYGNGVSEKPASGEFLLSMNGDRAVGRLLPAGMYSGLLSDKHAGRLTSPEFTPEGKSTLWLLVNGDGQAINRYVVQNYPRSGTVYQVERLGPSAAKKKKGEIEEKKRADWHWKAYNLDYWAGDHVHIELATARDTPLLVEPNDRSWFGIRQALLLESGQPAPSAAEREFIGAVVAAAGPSPALASGDDLASLYSKTARESIESWRDGSITDAQALFLDKLLEEELLANRLSELPGAAALIAEYRKLEAEIKAPVRVPGLDEWTGSDQPLFDRGDHKKPLQAVSRRFLETVDAKRYHSTQSGRLELADDLLREDNPFTRRVIVNRVWTHLFGDGIVASVDNFGRLGEKPSHAELLDDLASRFGREMGWSLKSLIREIVRSAVWQQESLASPEAKTQDPGNRLLSHFPVRRLEAEAIRDKLLFVSGLLDDTMYGPAIDGRDRRRSVYVRVIRNDLDPFLGVFDAPVPFTTTGKRPETNVPAQSLTMLNDPGMKAYRDAFYQKHLGAASDDTRIRGLWSEALGRSPSHEEMEASRRLIARLRSGNDSAAREAAELRQQIEKLSEANRGMIEAARQKLEAQLGGGARKAIDYASLGAIVSWNFANDGTDAIRGLGGKLTGNARVENGRLVLDGQSSFFSDPVSTGLGAKTMEVLLTLDTLQQGGGGAVTVQDLQGNLFDSIVFGERKTGAWMAGSNNFKRTDDFQGEPENEAITAPIHLAITYDSDGAIRCYRNGIPYGKPVRKAPLQPFAKDGWQVVLGLRHGTANGTGRNLRGAIHEARVYNSALDEATIASLAAGKNVISRQAVLDSLDAGRRETCLENEKKIAELTGRMALLEKEGEPVGEAAVWGNYIHSLFNLKEFIYID